MRSWWWKLGLALAGILVLAAIFPVRAHYRAKRAVAQYRAELLAKGESLGIKGLLRPVASPGVNGVAPFHAAATQAGMPYDLSVPAMRYLSPGHGLLSWKQPVLLTDTTTNLWGDLQAALEARREAVTALRQSLECDYLDFALDYEQLYSMPMSHLVPLRDANRTLTAAVVYDLHLGQPGGARTNLAALLRLRRLTEAEPLLVSQMVGFALLPVRASWEALHYPEWRDEELAELQGAWMSVRVFDGLRASFEMERAMSGAAFERMRQDRAAYMLYTGRGGGPGPGGQNPLSDLADLLAKEGATFAKLREAVAGYWIWKWWESYHEELDSLRVWQAGLEALRTVETASDFHRCCRQVKTTVDSLGAGDAPSPVSSSGEMVLRVLNRAGNVEAQRQMTVAAIALKRYHLRHGKYPATWTDLVPAFLPAVPVDVMDGKPLRYRPKPTGGYLLYSVGEDGHDDGGDPTESKADGISDKMWRGRDWVWPEPAGEEEVRREMDKLLKTRRPRR